MVLVQAFLTVEDFVSRFGERNAAGIFGLTFAAANCLAYISIPYAWMVFPVSLLGGLQGAAFPSLTALATHPGACDATGRIARRARIALQHRYNVRPLFDEQTLRIYGAHRNTTPRRGVRSGGDAQRDRTVIVDCADPASKCARGRRGTGRSHNYWPTGVIGLNAT